LGLEIFDVHFYRPCDRPPAGDAPLERRSSGARSQGATNASTVFITPTCLTGWHYLSRVVFPSIYSRNINNSPIKRLSPYAPGRFIQPIVSNLNSISYEN
jgi:hypothetical protein